MLRYLVLLSAIGSLFICILYYGDDVIQIEQDKLYVVESPSGYIDLLDESEENVRVSIFSNVEEYDKNIEFHFSHGDVTIKNRDGERVQPEMDVSYDVEKDKHNIKSLHMRYENRKNLIDQHIKEKVSYELFKYFSKMKTPELMLMTRNELETDIKKFLPKHINVDNVYLRFTYSDHQLYMKELRSNIRK